MVRTLLFHGNNMGSNPIKDEILFLIYNFLEKWLSGLKRRSAKSLYRN